MATDKVYRVGERGVFEYVFDYSDLSAADGVKSIALAGFPQSSVYRITNVALRKTTDFTHVTGENLYLSVWLNNGGSGVRYSLMTPRLVSDGSAAVDYNLAFDNPGREIMVHGSVVAGGTASTQWAEIFGYAAAAGLSNFSPVEDMALTDWRVSLVTDTALSSAGSVSLTPQVCAGSALPIAGNFSALPTSLDSFKAGSALEATPEITFTAASSLVASQSGLYLPVDADQRLTVKSVVTGTLHPNDLCAQFWMRLIPRAGDGWAFPRPPCSGLIAGAGAGGVTLNLDAYLSDPAGSGTLLSNLTSGEARLLVHFEEVV